MFATIAWELKQRRSALFWWTLISVGLAIVIMGLYPSIRDQANQLNKVINTLPQGLRELKTGGSGSVNVADPIAFLNSQLFYATLPILWIILAITRGSSILGSDEQNRTLELLLARPISRGRLLLAKAVSYLIEFVMVGGITLASIILFAPLFGLHVGSSKLAIVTLYTILFSLSFGLLAYALQAVGNLTRRVASALAILISFGGYLLASLSGLTHWLQNPAKLAPYHYFAPDKIMHGQHMLGLNIYLAVVVTVTASLSYWGFRRRDIS